MEAIPNEDFDMENTRIAEQALRILNDRHKSGKSEVSKKENLCN